MAEKNILDRWGITADELTEVVDANPSLRGFMLGYVGEAKLRATLVRDRRISNLRKYDDHDRTKKGDLAFEYDDMEVRVEVKSLQTKTVKQRAGGWTGTFQCDASDRRPVLLPNGHTVETTCLLVDEFDVLAVNLHAFGGKWKFAYARNTDLPRTVSKKYSPQDQKYLLATSMAITWPLEPPFEDEPFRLLDGFVREKKRKR